MTFGKRKNTCRIQKLIAFPHVCWKNLESWVLNFLLWHFWMSIDCSIEKYFCIRWIRKVITIQKRQEQDWRDSLWTLRWLTILFRSADTWVSLRILKNQFRHSFSLFFFCRGLRWLWNCSWAAKVLSRILQKDVKGSRLKNFCACLFSIVVYFVKNPQNDFQEQNINKSTLSINQVPEYWLPSFLIFFCNFSCYQ